MGNNCFSNVIINVFLLDIVLTHLNAPDLQTGKISAFTGVVTLADNQLIKWI